MEVKVENRDGTLCVDGEMTIYCAAQLKSDLFAAAHATAPNIRLDLSAVSAMDTAGLQIMLMIRRMAESSGFVLDIRNPSPAVSEVFTLCGLKAWLPPSTAAS